MMDDLGQLLNRYFKVVVQGQSYLNLIFLLLAFPLGLGYFIFLTVGLSLGLSLAVIWIGLPILLLVFATWLALAAFERQTVIHLLRKDVAPLFKPPQFGGVGQRIRTILSSSATWKSLVYLFAKFPLGLISFITTVFMLALAGGLTAAPFLYRFNPVRLGLWRVDSLSEALVVALIGLMLWPLALHIFNGLAYISAMFAQVLLGSPESQAQGHPPATTPNNSVGITASIPTQTHTSTETAG